MGKHIFRHDWEKKDKRLTGGVRNNDHRYSFDRRLGIASAGKSQLFEVIVQVDLSVIIFRGIVSPSLARVQTTQEGGGIQFGCNGV